ncbi:hypothetical protein, partial [Nocardia abscessus]|uniref:hypothetical protein n=1 Tax=Nocardia abscessus TaxID=120957 RepID=UPI003CC7CA54
RRPPRAARPTPGGLATGRILGGRGAGTGTPEGGVPGLSSRAGGSVAVVLDASCSRPADASDTGVEGAAVCSLESVVAVSALEAGGADAGDGSAVGADSGSGGMVRPFHWRAE